MGKMQLKIFKISRDRFYLKAYENQSFFSLINPNKEIKQLFFYDTVINPGDKNYEAIKKAYQKKSTEEKIIMKFKMFYFSESESISSIEDVVNQWLEEKSGVIIKHFSQSEASDEGLTVSVFYEER